MATGRGRCSSSCCSGTAASNRDAAPGCPVLVGVLLAVAAVLPAVLRCGPAPRRCSRSAALCAGAYFAAGLRRRTDLPRRCPRSRSLVALSARRARAGSACGARGRGAGGTGLVASGPQSSADDDRAGTGCWQGDRHASRSSAAAARSATAVRSRCEAARRAGPSGPRTEERLRMAQDLHDGVGHGLAVIAMQAGVALHVLDRTRRRPARSLEAIRADQPGVARRAARRAGRLMSGDRRGPPAGPPGSPTCRRCSTGCAPAGWRSTSLEAASAACRSRSSGPRTRRPGVAHQRAAARRRRPARRCRSCDPRRRRWCVDRARRRARADGGRAGCGHGHQRACGRGSRRSAARSRRGRGAGGGLPGRRGVCPEAGMTRDPGRSLVDDQPLVRMGLATLIDAEPDLELVGEAADGREALAMLRRTPPRRGALRHPDAGARRPGAARRRSPPTPSLADVRVVMLTTFELDEYVFEALRARRQRVPAQGRRAGRAAATRSGSSPTAARCSPRR